MTECYDPNQIPPSQEFQIPKMSNVEREKYASFPRPTDESFPTGQLGASRDLCGRSHFNLLSDTGRLGNGFPKLA